MDIVSLREKILNSFETHYHDLDVRKKSEKDPVTQIDLEVSKIVKDHFLNQSTYQNYTYYCEEDHSDLNYPCIILDPIDGTRELVKGLPESCLSLAIVEEDNKKEIFAKNFAAWLYNPFTGMEVSNLTPVISSRQRGETRLGLISRREKVDHVLTQNFSEKSQVCIVPKGSIAYKLGLLAIGGADFVVSMRPKNLWDIAAGTLLLWQRGMVFLEQGKELTHLKEKYLPPLVWCHENDKSFFQNYHF